MAKYTVPGWKESTGISERQLLVPGDYHFQCIKAEVREPKNPQPRDDWYFQFAILDGPVQENGKKAKKFTKMFFIKKPEHPDFKPEQFSVDQMKSMAMAMGLSFKGEGVTPDAFLNGEFVGRVVRQPNYKDSEKIENEIAAYMPVK